MHEPTYGASFRQFDDPAAWSVSIEPTAHAYHVCLVNGAIKRGPDGGSWVRLTLNGARRKGERELAKNTRQLEAKRQRRERLARALGISAPGAG